MSAGFYHRNRKAIVAYMIDIDGWETKFVITYTDMRTGKRIRYMNIGFMTEERAADEVKILTRKKISFPGNYPKYCPASVCGVDFKIEPIKVKIII